jgi:hypothetical protein
MLFVRAMSTIEMIKIKFETLSAHMDEKVRRLWVAAEAKALGRGGIAKVVKATGVSPKTIKVGMIEIEQKHEVPAEKKKSRKIRRKGGGRRALKGKDITLIPDLENLLDPVTRGDPESPLRWSSKSTSKLAEELRAKGHVVSPRTVASLLHQLEYSLQGNKKTKEGTNHPDRDAQFMYINEQVRAFQDRGQPVISIDTKKKELIGEYKNNGQEWQPKGKPIEVNGHDFPDPNEGKVVPHGLYDIIANKGWVNVGISRDTAEFAVESIRRWWKQMGRLMYPDAGELLITADCGGSNGYRIRLWKYELQRFVNESGLKITVNHFPPGTSKWNKIEHRMFCHITENWRGRPLTSVEVVVNLIANTRTKTGLTIVAQLDENIYQKGRKVSDYEMSTIKIEEAEFHGEWNYSIIPIAK